MVRTILVVPCHNEAARLNTEHFAAFVQQHADIDVLFVDDGSTDATPRILRELTERHHGRLQVHTLERNRGKAEAVRQGMLRAFGSGAEFVAYWDADLATPLDAVPQFRSVLEERPECQLAMGSRVALLGRRIERSYGRHVCGRLFATVASRTLGLAVYDTQCGAKMFRVSSKMQAVFARPFLSRWIFDVEVLARMVRGGLCDKRTDGDDPIFEIPLQEWRDVPGSRLRGRDLVRAVWELWRIRLRYGRARPQGPPPVGSEERLAEDAASEDTNAA